MTVAALAEESHWEVVVARGNTVIYYVVFIRDAAARIYDRCRTLPGFLGAELMMFRCRGEEKKMVDFCYLDGRDN